MSDSITITPPPGLRKMLETLAAVTPAIRAALEQVLAEEMISLEEDLRGPTPDSPGQGDPSGPHRLSPGPGLVPVNTGRLLQSYTPVIRGLSAVLTADAQDPKSGYFYGAVAHHAGLPKGDTVRLVTRRWEALGERVSAGMTRVMDQHLRGKGA